MVNEIKAAMSMEMSTTPNELMKMSPIELEDDLEPITQTPTKTNEKSTPMEVDTDQRKRKINNDNEEPTTTNRITPARTLRTQRNRGIASTPKKSLKEGQKTD